VAFCRGGAGPDQARFLLVAAGRKSGTQFKDNRPRRAALPPLLL
jgi:hypothetical protein